MKYFKITWVVFLFLGFTLQAQTNIKKFTFKKGEVLDILLVTVKPEGKSLFKRYRETAFPVAVKRSYSFLPKFGITQSTQGSFQPDGLIFGKWSSLENREKFLDEIVGFVPDFHQQRRDIFSIFNLTYYEVPENTSFDIDTSKYNVVTAYWQKDVTAFKSFKTEWEKKVITRGGKKTLTLTNGKSTLGYYYNPDYLTITTWDNKEAFEKFYHENLQMNHNSVLHVNQFVIK